MRRKTANHSQVKEEPIDGGWDESLSMQRQRSAPLYGLQHFQVSLLIFLVFEIITVEMRRKAGLYLERDQVK